MYQHYKICIHAMHADIGNNNFSFLGFLLIHICICVSRKIPRNSTICINRLTTMYVAIWSYYGIENHSYKYLIITVILVKESNIAT